MDISKKVAKCCKEILADLKEERLKREAIRKAEGLKRTEIIIEPIFKHNLIVKYCTKHEISYNFIVKVLALDYEFRTVKKLAA